MPELVACPAKTCVFEGSIQEVVNHIAATDDEEHLWTMLDHQSADDFCFDTHLDEGETLQKAAQEARDPGEFVLAIENLERTLHHFQRAKLYANDPTAVETRCRDVLGLIEELETAEQKQSIDDLVNRAENAIDSGDAAHFEDEPGIAEQKYDEAVDALTEARSIATELDSDQAQELEQRLRQVRVRQQSLGRSASHRAIRDAIAAAREHTAGGDRAFQNSEYDVALNAYENAKGRYKALTDVLQEFSFDEPTADPEVCDVCRQQFSNELDSWQIDLGVSLHVCPSCARFGSDGNLPSPREVATEHRAIVENIESIRDGDVGLTWTSHPHKPEAVDAGSAGRNTQQMLLQLVGLYQQLGEPPTAENLDEYTDFGYLAYRDEFGSLSEAFEAAGLDS